MSSVNSNFGSEALSSAMIKKATDAQGRIAMQLLSGAAQTASNAQSSAPVNSPAPSPNLAVGGTINTYA